MLFDLWQRQIELNTQITRACRRAHRTTAVSYSLVTAHGPSVDESQPCKRGTAEQGAQSRMPCTCARHSATTTCAYQAGSRRFGSHRSALISAPQAFRHQLPLPTQEIAVRRSHRSSGDKQAENRTSCCAQQREEKEKDMVGGFDVDAEPGFLESEAVGTIFKVQSANAQAVCTSC